MRFFCASMALAILMGCGGPTGDIQAEYSKIARQTGIIPVFPPDEKYFVGQFHAVSAGGTNDVLRQIIGADKEVLKHAEEYMATLPVFRPTLGDSTKGLIENAPAQTDTYGPGLSRRSELRIESLPIEPLPEVTADASAALGFGFSNPLAAIGLAGGTRTKVRVNFGDVRTYGIPMVALTQTGYDPQLKAGQANLNSGPRNIDWIELALANKYQAAISAGRKITKYEDRCRATILVTKVYMTRKITMTFIDIKAGSLQAAQIQKGVTAAQTINVPPINVNIDNTTGQFNADGLQSDAQALTDEVAEVTPSSEGVSRGLTFEGFNSLGANYSLTYQRPVIVGYEGWPFFTGTSKEGLDTCKDTLGLGSLAQ